MWSYVGQAHFSAKSGVKIDMYRENSGIGFVKAHQLAVISQNSLDVIA